MLRNIIDFARGLAFGLVIGGAVGLLMAPAPGEEAQSILQARIEAAKAAFEEGRSRAEGELLEYFEQARKPSTGS